MEEGAMELNLAPEWHEGDMHTITQAELDRLIAEGLYDSYDRVYLFGGVRWEMAYKVAHAGGVTAYTLKCVGKA
jgi:hypothetical protein